MIVELTPELVQRAVAIVAGDVEPTDEAELDDVLIVLALLEEHVDSEDERRVLEMERARLEDRAGKRLVRLPPLRVPVRPHLRARVRAMRRPRDRRARRIARATARGGGTGDDPAAHSSAGARGGSAPAESQPRGRAARRLSP